MADLSFVQPGEVTFTFEQPEWERLPVGWWDWRWGPQSFMGATHQDPMEAQTSCQLAR